MPPTVFVIDDEECIRDSIKWLLEDLGYHVITASEPESCDVYQQHHCSQDNPCGHALIIDHDLPNLTALDFIEQMIACGCKGMVSNMLVISGNVLQVDMEKATTIGCTVAQKPVSLDYLRVWLGNLPLMPPPG